MDFATRPFVELAKPFRDSNYTALRSWQPADLSAEGIPWEHRYGTLLWTGYGDEQQQFQPGSVPNTFEPIPTVVQPFPTLPIIGSQDDWERGVSSLVAFDDKEIVLFLRLSARMRSGIGLPALCDLEVTLDADLSPGVGLSALFDLEVTLDADLSPGVGLSALFDLEVTLDADLSPGVGLSSLFDLEVTLDTVFNPVDFMWSHKRITYLDMDVASNEHDVTIDTQGPILIVLATQFRIVTAFVGGMSNYTFTYGIAGDEIKYQTTFSLTSTGPCTRGNGIDAPWVESCSAATDFVARFTADSGDLDELTAGEVDIWLLHSSPP